MSGKHAESSGAVEHTGTQSRSEENYFFAGFTFAGDQNLDALAGFYGLSVPVLEPRITLADYLARTCYGSPRPGYRVELGNVELIVQQLEEGAITKVGLRLLCGARAHRRHVPLGTRYSIGASLVRRGRGLTGTAAPPR
jgi:NhaP-type Na+/H+ and K+/H+ antiporter